MGEQRACEWELDISVFNPAYTPWGWEVLELLIFLSLSRPQGLGSYHSSYCLHPLRMVSRENDSPP